MGSFGGYTPGMGKIPVNPRYEVPQFFLAPDSGPDLMTRGCFGMLRLAAARPV